MSTAVLAVLFVFAFPAFAWGEAPSAPASSSAELYRQLRSVRLDAAKTFQARDVAIDKEDIHISLNDGTIAFTEAVNGRITGAFFAGEGEVLMVVPSQPERASLALFTGQAVLEEKFSTAYFRFSDNTFDQLLPDLRSLRALPSASSESPSATAVEFVSRWNPVARNLAQEEALRLLAAFTNSDRPSPQPVFRARLGGGRLGTLDITLDREFAEQVSVAQAGFSQNGVRYYDILASFPMRSERLAPSPARGDALRLPGPLLVSGYSIRAHVLPPSRMEADAALDVTCLKPGQRTLFFELSRYLALKSVKLNGNAVGFLQNEAVLGSELERRGNDVVAVLLPQPLPTGQKVKLDFSYSGDVMSEAGGGLMYVGARGIWYPNLGPAMANFDLEFRYPSSWSLLATGRQISLDTVGGEQVARWRSERTIPLAGFNLGRYVSSESAAGRTAVAVYAARGVENALMQPLPATVEVPRLDRRHATTVIVQPAPPPPSPAQNIHSLAQRAAETVQFISRRIGSFPYSTLALTQMPGRESQGWPGLVFLSSYAFLAPEKPEGNDQLEFSRILYRSLMPAHEIAHQWWGDGVLWSTYRDEWLMESLANYMALLEIEQHSPAEFKRVMEHYRQGLLRRNSRGLAYHDAGPVTLGRRLSSSKFPDGYDVIAYGRGTWLIHMLRSMLHEAVMQSPPSRGNALGKKRAPDDASAAPLDGEIASGDEIFFAALRDLLRTHAGESLSTEEFLDAFEGRLPAALRYESKSSLRWFLEGWLNGTAVPKFETSQVHFAQHNGRLVASGKLLQSEAPQELVTSVPLYASSGYGEPVFLGRVFADGPETNFQLTVPPATRKILVDPNRTVLSRP